jgi:uncharacterized protein YbbC (DUF1343 family)
MMAAMIGRYAGAACLVAALAGPAPAAAPDWTALEAAAREAVEAAQTPGVVILVGQGERDLYRQAVGARALAPAREAMTLDTVFDVASLTKVVATVPAVLALWEDGRLDLDAPLGRYLPEYAGPEYAAVTIRRILTHAAGFPDLPQREAVARGFPDAARALAAQGLRSAPGEAFRYSDTGFILLAEVVRRVSGEPLDRLVERRFYRPLGMRDTRFRPPAAWRSRIAPTERVNGLILRGVVHDANARLLGGVAGHAGLFSTADDLARFSRMLLDGGRARGRRYLRPDTVRAMFEPHVTGETTRALGWDIASPYSRALGSFFRPGSLGHTGFTGTALWLDPGTRSFVIILSNRVHPDGKGDAVELRRRVSAAVGARLFGGGEPPPVTLAAEALAPAAEPRGPGGGRTRSGLDQLVAQGFGPLAGRMVGLVTNQTGVDAQGRRGIDLLAAAPGATLRALFSPEHGLQGQLDATVPHGRDAPSGLPVFSLYGATRRPTPEMLAGIDTLVFDIQDVGVRFYTYLATLLYVLEEAARHGIAVVVLDRPNPLTGRAVEGPVMDPDLRSFTAPHALPVRTGLTIGEFARLVVAEREIPVRLTVVPLDGWSRGLWYDETGLPWVNPSPNIRSPLQALLYAGLGLLEMTNLSVGRGTDTPFEVVGAPWITDPEALAGAMNARGLPGARFEPASFMPQGSVYKGELLGGVRLRVTDREAIRPVTVALALARELMERYPARFRPEAIQTLLVSRATMWALLRLEPLERIRRRAEAEREQFLRRRAPHLLYR